MAPGSIFIISIFQYLVISFAIYFTCIFISLYHKNTKNITLSYLSDLTLVGDRQGIDNPFIALVARFLFVFVGTRDLHVASYWIDTLDQKTEGNTYATLLHHPFLFKEKPTQCSRGSRRPHASPSYLHKQIRTLQPTR